MQSNHLHFILETDTNQILSKGMRSLTITFAKGLKQGRVQLERYHLHVLKSVQETKNAIAYVLFNQQKHERGAYSVIDEYSSLLCLKNALVLIRNFAKTQHMYLKIRPGDRWEPDRRGSFLLQKGLHRLEL